MKKKILFIFIILIINLSWVFAAKGPETYKNYDTPGSGHLELNFDDEEDKNNSENQDEVDKEDVRVLDIDDARYKKYTQVFNINLGTTFHDATIWQDQSKKVGEKKMYPGGSGSLSFMINMLSYLRIGGELGYDFYYTNKMSLLTVVPITFNLGFFVQIDENWDFPFNLKLGVAYLKHQDKHYFAPTMSLTAGFTYYITESWGIGLEAGFSFFSEFYSSDTFRNNTTFTSPLRIAISYRR